MGNWHEAELSLRQADSIIAGIIEHTGPCELIKHEGGFAGLANSIIGQQLSNQVPKIITRITFFPIVARRRLIFLLFVHRNTFFACQNIDI